MKDLTSDAIKYVLEVAWRRRRLIVVPLVLVMTLTTLLAYVLPRQYSARALLVMQEQGADNPLIKSQTTNERIRDRAPGLQALLKSDRVLGNAMRDILGDRMPTDPRQIALVLKELDQQLSFEMIGSDFLEFQLKGSNPKGLGKKLEAVTSRFLESILSPDQDAVSATQVLLERRREDLATAEKALERYRAQIDDRTLAAITASRQRATALVATNERLASELAATSGDISSLAAAAGLAVNTLNARSVASAIEAAGAELAAADRRGAAAGRATDDIRTRLVNLRRIEAQLARKTEIERTIASNRAVMAADQAAADDPRAPEGQLRRLERDVAEARQLYESYARRFPTTANPQSSIQVLRAPERIRVIDAPKDPEFPLTSRLKYILAGLVGALLLSAGLVAGAEMFEPRVRSTRDFESITGVPVLARLPFGVDGASSEDGSHDDADPAPSGRDDRGGDRSASSPIILSQRRQSAA